MEVDQADPRISHVDLFHKLGRVEALIETMMSSMSSFQAATKDIHARIDNIEKRQNASEAKDSVDRGASGALIALFKDFAIPVVAIAVTWMVATKDQRSIPGPSAPTPVYPHEYSNSRGKLIFNQHECKQIRDL
jgi:hypothetical protein